MFPFQPQLPFYPFNCIPTYGYFVPQHSPFGSLQTFYTRQIFGPGTEHPLGSLPQIQAPCLQNDEAILVGKQPYNIRFHFDTSTSTSDLVPSYCSYKEEENKVSIPKTTLISSNNSAADVRMFMLAGEQIVIPIQIEITHRVNSQEEITIKKEQKIDPAEVPQIYRNLSKGDLSENDLLLFSEEKKSYFTIPVRSKTTTRSSNEKFYFESPENVLHYELPLRTKYLPHSDFWRHCFPQSFPSVDLLPTFEVHSKRNVPYILKTPLHIVDKHNQTDLSEILKHRREVHYKEKKFDKSSKPEINHVILSPLKMSNAKTDIRFDVPIIISDQKSQVTYFKKWSQELSSVNSIHPHKNTSFELTGSDIPGIVYETKLPSLVRILSDEHLDKDRIIAPEISNRHITRIPEEHQLENTTSPFGRKDATESEVEEAPVLKYSLGRLLENSRLPANATSSFEKKSSHEPDDPGLSELTSPPIPLASIPKQTHDTHTPGVIPRDGKSPSGSGAPRSENKVSILFPNDLYMSTDDAKQTSSATPTVEAVSQIAPSHDTHAYPAHTSMHFMQILDKDSHKPTGIDSLVPMNNSLNTPRQESELEDINLKGDTPSETIYEIFSSISAFQSRTPSENILAPEKETHRVDETVYALEALIGFFENPKVEPTNLEHAHSDLSLPEETLYTSIIQTIPLVEITQGKRGALVLDVKKNDTPLQDDVDGLLVKEEYKPNTSRKESPSDHPGNIM